jgi:hypothetical protein
LLDTNLVLLEDSVFMVFPGKQEILELKSFIIFDEKEKLFF